MIFRTLKFALLLFLLSPVALADSSGLSPKAEAAVEATVHKFMKAHGLDGVGLGILSNRRMVYANGFGNVNRYSPVDIASLSKSLTAILAMRLSEQGKLDLDAPVTRYLPDLDLPSSVTSRSILSHSSGLPHYGSHFPGSHFSLKNFTKSSVTSSTGSYLYSSPGYFLLSRVLEKAGGKDYLELVHSEICRPSYASKDQVSLHPAVAWRLGAGGLEASPEAMTRIVYALMQGRLVKSENLSQMWSEQVPVPGSQAGQGLGFRVEGESKVWHGGQHSKLGQYNRLVLYPRKGHGMIVLVRASRKFTPGKLSTELYRALKAAGHKF